jgi:hypothetical protein
MPLSFAGCLPWCRRLRPRELLAHQLAQHCDIEAMCQYDRLGAAVRAAREELQRPPLLVSQLRHWSTSSPMLDFVALKIEGPHNSLCLAHLITSKPRPRASLCWARAVAITVRIAAFTSSYPMRPLSPRPTISTAPPLRRGFFERRSV